MKGMKGMTSKGPKKGADDKCVSYAPKGSSKGAMKKVETPKKGKMK